MHAKQELGIWKEGDGFEEVEDAVMRKDLGAFDVDTTMRVAQLSGAHESKIRASTSESRPVDSLSRSKGAGQGALRARQAGCIQSALELSGGGARSRTSQVESQRETARRQASRG
jgi:hypothetical protein